MHGIIPLYKPKGMTSHDCVYKIRRLLGIKKVGHTGTLDPTVDGVLPICVGEATKIIPFVSQYKKEYIATVTVGKSTTTEDAEGEVVDTKVLVDKLEPKKVEAVLKTFLGEIVQTPPMYSAVKVNGKKLYEYARKGLKVERPKRTITIFNLELMEVNMDSFKFKVNCSKGTYIRTLCVKVGNALGYPAFMSDLTRTESEGIHIEQTVSFADIKNKPFEACIYPIVKFLSHIPSIEVNETQIENVLNGQRYYYPNQQSKQYKLMYNGILLGISEQDVKNKDLLKPTRVFRLYHKEGVKNEDH